MTVIRGSHPIGECEYLEQSNGRYTCKVDGVLERCVSCDAPLEFTFVDGHHYNDHHCSAKHESCKSGACIRHLEPTIRTPSFAEKLRDAEMMVAGYWEVEDAT